MFLEEGFREISWTIRSAKDLKRCRFKIFNAYLSRGGERRRLIFFGEMMLSFDS